MKKSILAIAVAATMAAPAAVMAAPTVYGNVNLSVVVFDKDDGTGQGSNGDPDLTSNTSAIGVKGSEDLGDGLKAIYKVEFQLDATGDSGNGNALTQRDVFAGLKGGWGTFKVGAFSSNYKQMGGKVDALYRTPAEGRGFIHTQSNLHNGRAINRGRMTNALSYTTPKMAGFSLVLNTTASDSNDETTGVGIRWSNKAFMAYVDWIDAQIVQSNIGGTALPPGTIVNPSTNATESAVKVGGKFNSKAFFAALQYEAAEDLTGYNYIHANGGFNINKNNAIILTLGQAEHVDTADADTTGVALAYNHKMSKMTNVYVAYADRSSDTTEIEDSVFVLGIRKKF